MTQIKATPSPRITHDCSQAGDLEGISKFTLVAKERCSFEERYYSRFNSVPRRNGGGYAQAEVPGTIDHLVDELRDKYQRPVPAADLLMSNPYKELMPLVVDTKDLGSGVIRGVECDHLAFRTGEIDWQIWIAQGERPYPCRYVITSNKVAGSPQYTIDVTNWKTGTEVAADSFSLQIPTGTKKINPSDLPDFDELPAIFAIKR